MHWVWIRIQCEEFQSEICVFFVNFSFFNLQQIFWVPILVRFPISCQPANGVVSHDYLRHPESMIEISRSKSLKPFWLIKIGFGIIKMEKVGKNWYNNQKALTGGKFVFLVKSWTTPKTPLSCAILINLSFRTSFVKEKETNFFFFKFFYVCFDLSVCQSDSVF